MNVLGIGMKIDITPEPDGLKEELTEDIIYSSQIQDIFPNGDLEIDMPVHQRKLILLHNGVRYQFVFHSEKNTYMAIGEVVERYKSNNRYLVRVQLKTELAKFQRREYFRCECMMDMFFHLMTTDDLSEVHIQHLLGEYEQKEMGSALKEGTILDISGGGIRYVSRERLEVGDCIRIVFYLPVEGTQKRFNLAGKVLSNQLIQDSKIKYESRVKFLYISDTEREGIIKFIFEEERRSRKLSRG